MTRKPIFIDRDGVLNRDIEPYVCRMEDFEIFPYTVEALTMLDRAGYDIYIVSNQQGLSLGIIPQEVLDEATEQIQAALRPQGFEIKKFYYCTDLDSARNPWRKPNPGMILSARDEFGLTIEGSFMIGDKWSDIECGARAGCRPLLVMSGVTSGSAWQSWRCPPEKAFPTLFEAAQWIVQESSRG
jgi:histidinol-phosphate phosphatase family protein